MECNTPARGILLAAKSADLASLSCPQKACLSSTSSQISRYFLLHIFTFCGVCGSTFSLQQLSQNSLFFGLLSKLPVWQHCLETTLTQNKGGFFSDSALNPYFTEYFTRLKYMREEGRGKRALTSGWGARVKKCGQWEWLKSFCSPVTLRSFLRFLADSQAPNRISR